MGRKPAFDRQDVLAKATQVFLTSGYQGTTVKDITNATGLQPGSIYSAFVNKEGLYTEVVEYYTSMQLKIIDKDARKKLRISRDKADKPAKPMFEKINADKKLEIKELLGNENYLKYVSFEENWTKLRREERRKQNKEKRKSASK